MAETIVDARGRACPEPVLMTKKALASGSKDLKILVDNAAALGNVQRFLKKNGKAPTVAEKDGYSEISVS